MKEDQYSFWINWRLGLVNRELTNEEKSNIRANEFAMHLLFPIESANLVLDKCNGYIDKLILDTVAEQMAVPYELVFFQIQDAIKQRKTKENNQETTFHKHTIK